MDTKGDEVKALRTAADVRLVSRWSRSSPILTTALASQQNLPHRVWIYEWRQAARCRGLCLTLLSSSSIGMHLGTLAQSLDLWVASGRNMQRPVSYTAQQQLNWHAFGEIGTCWAGATSRQRWQC